MKNTIQTKVPEILVPAGDLQRLKTAVNFGADAVYIGGDAFSMRAAVPFCDEDMKAGVEYAHKNGVRVYLTINTLPTNTEIDTLPDYLKRVKEIGPDAVIVSDMGVMSIVKKILPDMEIHMSTQTGIVNYVTARELYNMGAKRVVLARELNLDDIKTIRDKTPPELEIETFVHGSMCVSFSGRCLLSSYLVSRDANRGECAQPCRWGYHLMEEKRPGQYFPIFEDEQGSYILNAKDMCMIEHLDKLLEAGITSFKIEGRAKAEYYVGVVANAYRLACDELLKDPKNYKLDSRILEEVYKVSHREYSTGFFFGRPENAQCYKSGGYVRNYDVVAVVERSDDDFIYLSQRNKFNKGDVVEFLEPKSLPISQKLDVLYDETGEQIESANHAMMNLKIPKFKDIKEGTILRKAK